MDTEETIDYSRINLAEFKKNRSKNVRVFDAWVIIRGAQSKLTSSNPPVQDELQNIRKKKKGRKKGKSLFTVRKENCTPLSEENRLETCSNEVVAGGGRKYVCVEEGWCKAGRASWQRVRAQTEFLMGDDPLFTDLSEAIVYDRPGLHSLATVQANCVLLEA